MHEISFAKRIGSVGLLGATSLVGGCLLDAFRALGREVVACSRETVDRSGTGARWLRLSSEATAASPAPEETIKDWICVAPIWVLPEHFGLLEANGACRVVALSSTSRFTKDDSSDAEEQEIAYRLTEAERCFQEWAEQRGIIWVILRPTLIYGKGRDKNIAEMARFIRRFGFFPLLGRATGLRQPVHAEDVAKACVAALDAPKAANRAFDLSGGETLPYSEMARRVFVALGRRPRLLSFPLAVFRIALACLRILPRYRHWSLAMAERMERDLVFDHLEAERELDFRPRSFQLTAEDVAP